MFIRKPVRALLSLGVAMLVFAGAGLTFAMSSNAVDTRWVTTTVDSGDISRTYTTAGTVSRLNTAVASFATNGVVKSVPVSVGDQVQAGDTLATLQKGPLQLAVLDAETKVAQKKSALYSAENPDARSSGSSHAGAAKAANSTTGSGSGTGSGTSTGVLIDPTVLSQASERLNQAVLAENQACEPVFGTLSNPETTPGDDSPPTQTPTPTPDDDSTPTPGDEATPTPTPVEGPTPTPTATPDSDETASPAVADAGSADRESDTEDQSASLLVALIEAADPSTEELQACGQARAELAAANTNLQQVVASLLTSSSPGATGAGSSTQKPTSTSGSAASSATSVSAGQVTAAKADLLAAEQELRSARNDLAATELDAPISGTVGAISLKVGDSASAGTITVLGSGDAQVSIELPLRIRSQVSVGQTAKVTPAGSMTVLDADVSNISLLETSGTSGDSPTYTTTLQVSDPDLVLASGARASVTLPVATVTSVVRVPVSALTPTGSGTGTVEVLEAGADTPAVVEVTTGVVGQGWVEITGGLAVDQRVVLADRTRELPANANGRPGSGNSTTTTRAETSVAK